MASTTATLPATAAYPARPLRMTYDEYVAWGEQDGHRGEWVDGEVIVFMTTSDRHQRILNFLVTVLTNYLIRLRAGEIASQQFELRTREGAAREPDIFVLLNAHLDRLEKVRVRGAADLVIEIISPDSVDRDGRVKRAEYASAGVPEYWIIDPREGREAIEVLMLTGEGEYRPVEPDAGGRLASLVLPGVWADPAWLAFGDPLPDVIDLSLRMVDASRAGEEPA